MAAEQQDQDRSEAATPFKLQEARKRGSVAKSVDTSALLVLATAAFVLHFSASGIVDRQLGMYAGLLSGAHGMSFALDDIPVYLVRILSECLLTLLPLLLPVVGIALLGNFVQTGPVFSFFPLKPDLDRINPVSGFRRLFSMRLLVEGVKTVIKCALFAAVLYAVVVDALPVLLQTLSMPAPAAARVLHSGASTLVFRLTLVLLLIAAIDAVYSRWDFSKRMRMSRRDIRDEIKRREGDPRVKSRLRELQREAVKRAASLGRVKDADVLITNPVHLAVAIRYARAEQDAPVVVAKGAGFLAARMRAVARRHRVPVMENRRLARALFHRVALDRAVPAEHYVAIARILLWAYALRRRREGFAS